MSNDNPKRGQLEAEYAGNPHFKALVDAVFPAELGTEFADCINAHYDDTTEGRLLASGKRLSANVALAMYAGPPPRQFDPALWCRAEREMEPYARKVQGFFYPDDPEVLGTVEVDGVEVTTFDESGEPDGEHVVIDYTLPKAVDREVWRKRGPYDETHREMMEAIRVHQTRMTWTHYMLLLTRGD